MTDKDLAAQLRPVPKPSGRAAKTREAMIAAGRRLFAERPVDAVAIDDIVQEAKVAKGSFYNHFADKDALVRAITGDIRSSIERAVGLANAGVADPAARMARGICVYLRFAAGQPERAWALLRIQGGHTSMDAPLNRGVVEDVSAGLSNGRFVLPSLEAGVLLAMGVAQIALARICQSPADSEVLARQMCEVLLRGLGVAQAEADVIAAQAAAEIVAAL